MGNKKDDDEVAFDRNPILYTCHYCSSRVTTTVDFEYNIVSAFAFFGTLYILTPLQALIMLPIVVPLTKSSVHKCPNCFEELGSKKCLGVPDFDDEVLSFNFGECAVVLSRKILVLVVVLLGVLLWFTYIPPHVGGHNHMAENHKKIMKTWEDFKDECGSDVILENRVKASLHFDDHYYHNTIDWDGYIMKILTRKDTGVWGHNDHSVTLLIKMMPPDTSFPDLAVSFGTQVTQEAKSIFADLEQGDHVQFTATFMALQSTDNINHLHGQTLKKLDGKWTMDSMILHHKHENAHNYYVDALQQAPPKAEIKRPLTAKTTVDTNAIQSGDTKEDEVSQDEQ